MMKNDEHKIKQPIENVASGSNLSKYPVSIQKVYKTKITLHC